MAIQIKPPDTVIVLSPPGIPESIIRNRVKSKGSWIVKKLSELRHIDPEAFKKNFIDGEHLLFLGENHDLQIIKNSRKIPRVFFQNNRFCIETSDPSDKYRMRKAMEKWYRKKADRIINDRVDLYIEKIGKRPQDVKIKEQKRRWGSCTAKGKLYFNWRISMAPPGIIDYIVVHEMSHLVHPDHSIRFWQKVGSILPDYKVRRKWLKDNGLKLDF
ncbi:MAG: M48 family metallopeptidase [Actinobacteria bacterium]|nr:M48 family metallopeptidase [Actinomycetota bacterium]